MCCIGSARTSFPSSLAALVALQPLAARNSVWAAPVVKKARDETDTERQDDYAHACEQHVLLHLLRN